ncbi:MAG: putative acetyltransferase [Candidatus Paceibacteria bacterium]|jgi:putative acetyltransferase
MHIRPEEARDHERVFAIIEAAFDSPGEAKLVCALREQADPLISLVAEVDEQVVGHVVFSPATLLGHPELKVMGLAPVSVIPAEQKTGIGSALIQAGLQACRELGAQAAIVLGHAEYYPRFGFAPSVSLGIRSEYDVPDDLFMVMEFEAGALEGKSGMIRYHPAFKGL